MRPWAISRTCRPISSTPFGGVFAVTHRPPGGAWEIVRTYPHGHVVAVLHCLRELDLESILASRPTRERSLVTALIVARIIKPVSKLATAQALQEETAKSSLAIELELGAVQADELYEALDWLQERQKRIENKLANKHLQDGTLLLYDVSGSYYTGRRSKFVQYGHPRDGKPRFPQIVYGLLCNAEGCPISIEVFPGNTGDPNTLSFADRKDSQAVRRATCRHRW